MRNPNVILYDAAGNALAVSDGAVVGVDTRGFIVAGKDSSNNSKWLRTATDGTLRVDPTGTTVQPVLGPVTDAELRAAPVSVTGKVVATTTGATDEQIAAIAEQEKRRFINFMQTKFIDGDIDVEDSSLSDRLTTGLKLALIAVETIEKQKQATWDIELIRLIHSAAG